MMAWTMLGISAKASLLIDVRLWILKGPMTVAGASIRRPALPVITAAEEAIVELQEATVSSINR